MKFECYQISQQSCKVFVFVFSRKRKFKIYSLFILNIKKQETKKKELVIYIYGWYEVL